MQKYSRYCLKLVFIRFIFLTEFQLTEVIYFLVYRNIVLSMKIVYWSIKCSCDIHNNTRFILMSESHHHFFNSD
jgi:hypothetical protein